MKIINESTELVELGRLRPHPKNPRQGDVGAIHVSIEANGFYGSVIAQKSTGHIIAGNHRYLAAKHANAEAIPVTWVDVSDEEAVRILLADNRTNDLATYNDDALAELLQDLIKETGSLDGTGFDGDALDELLADLQVPDDDVWGNALGDLPDGDKAPFQQKTFTLHDEQVECVERALKVANGMGPYVDAVNENKNGNALSRVAELFLLWANEKGYE
jgi:ParB-like chromosome segregation protein Spo0J